MVFKGKDLAKAVGLIADTSTTPQKQGIDLKRIYDEVKRDFPENRKRGVAEPYHIICTIQKQVVRLQTIQRTVLYTMVRETVFKTITTPMYMLFKNCF